MVYNVRGIIKVFLLDKILVKASRLQRFVWLVLWCYSGLNHKPAAPFQTCLQKLSEKDKTKKSFFFLTQWLHMSLLHIVTLNNNTPPASLCPCALIMIVYGRIVLFFISLLGLNFVFGGSFIIILCFYFEMVWWVSVIGVRESVCLCERERECVYVL